MAKTQKKETLIIDNTQKTNSKLNQVPLVALVGLPNSGKSTLLNRLGNSRYKAVVANEAHTTRDVNYAEDVWENMYLKFVDTGGLVPDPEDKIIKLVQLKSWEAINNADLLVWVFDRKISPEIISDVITSKFWKCGKPYIIGVNKIDNPNHEQDLAEYAHFGGVDFINFSAANGYNLDVLMDSIVENLVKLGFNKGNWNQLEIDDSEQIKKGKKNNIVRQKADGSYYITRDTDEKGKQTNFRVLSAQEIENFEQKQNKTVEIDNIVFGLDGVLLDWKGPRSVNWNQANLEYATSITNKDLYYLSNILAPSAKFFDSKLKFELIKNGIKEGLASHHSQFRKPDPEFYRELVSTYNIIPSKTIFVDDKVANIEMARELGFWTILCDAEITDLAQEVENIECGLVDRVPKIPQILFLGKPNVGKSSLFNAMVGKQIQIVTEIAGTTLSVNDTMVERS